MEVHILLLVPEQMVLVLVYFTLYIMGKQDYMFLPSVKKIVKHHSNAVLETIDNCGHVVNIDASIEFNRIVISFFEKEI
jgi:pimeloyl-ACP methyl ester carboxylesterase